MRIDDFFDESLKQVKRDSHAATSEAARELERDIRAQIRRKFKSPSIAFMRGLKVHDYEGGSYVRLSPILSSHAEATKLKGNPNLWILLPEGKKLGFQRMGNGGFNWDTLKRRYGTRISFVPVGDGHVVLYRFKNRTVPIYKIRTSVTTKQRINFIEQAQIIAAKYGKH